MEFKFTDQTIVLNTATQVALMQEVTRRFRGGEGFALATINLDHLTKLAASPGYRRFYERQDIVVADGRPIVALSWLAGRPVELMPGSGIILPLCRLADVENVRVALVGSTSLALKDAAQAITKEVPDLDIALRIAPSGVFDPEGEEAGQILRRLSQADIGLCFLALGAPKQEILALRGRTEAPGVGFASVGAGLDFLGGHQRRAPVMVQQIGMEWLWRAMRSPVRLGPRYLRCLVILPGQVVQALRLRGKLR